MSLWVPGPQFHVVCYVLAGGEANISVCVCVCVRCVCVCVCRGGRVCRGMATKTATLIHDYQSTAEANDCRSNGDYMLLILTLFLANLYRRKGGGEGHRKRSLRGEHRSDRERQGERRLPQGLPVFSSVLFTVALFFLLFLFFIFFSARVFIFS